VRRGKGKTVRFEAKTGWRVLAKSRGFRNWRCALGKIRTDFAGRRLKCSRASRRLFACPPARPTCRFYKLPKNLKKYRLELSFGQKRDFSHLGFDEFRHV